MKVKGGQTITFSNREINLKVYTELGVWDAGPSDSLGSIRFELSDSTMRYKTFRPRPDAVFSFTLNKTLYATFDQYKELRPQTEPLGGMLAKTDTGLSLVNNVKRDHSGHVPR